MKTTQNSFSQAEGWKIKQNDAVTEPPKSSFPKKGTIAYNAAKLSLSKNSDRQKAANQKPNKAMQTPKGSVAEAVLNKTLSANGYKPKKSSSTSLVDRIQKSLNKSK